MKKHEVIQMLCTASLINGADYIINADDYMISGADYIISVMDKTSGETHDKKVIGSRHFVDRKTD